MGEREEPLSQTIKAMEARAHWSQVLSRVSRREARVVVERRGIPVAAIVSVQDLERLQAFAAQRREAFKALHATRAAFEDVPDDELEREVAKAVEEARAELRAEKQHAKTA